MMNKSFMRRAFSTSLLAICLLVAGENLAQSDQILSIPLNNAEKLKITGVAKDVIVANPIIADVTMLTPDQMIIIGKQAGRTTLLILDAQQKVIFNSMVVVSDGSGGLVTVHSSHGEDSYACAQNCTLIEKSNGTVNTGSSSSTGTSLGSADASAAAVPAPAEPAPITKVDSKIKMHVSPNGEITGTRTDVPTYGTPPQ